MRFILSFASCRLMQEDFLSSRSCIKWTAIGINHDRQLIFDANSETLCGICKIFETLAVFATVGPEAGVGGIREIRIFGGFVISTSIESESHS